MTPNTRLRPNSADIAAKVMDGEAIIINLSNGIYYSMDLVGGLVWSLVEGRHSLEEISAAISSAFDVEPGQAMADLERVVADLLAENLVVVHDGLALAAEPAHANGNGHQPYESPVLNKYRDMADLLALDPPLPGMEDIPWQETSGLSPGRE